MNITSDIVLRWAMADCLKHSIWKKIYDTFGDLETAFKNLSIETLQNAGIPKRSAERIIRKVQAVDLEKAKRDQEKCGAKILFREEEDFPNALKGIDDAPVFLFYKGDLQKIQRKTLAVVGSRMVSSEGKWACQNLLPEIVSSGFTIVSGMALGIDTLAHKTALQNGGTTVAFWGTGIDTIYPTQNQGLANEILTQGVVFSEFPLGTPPSPYNFPRRNRLVSGISDGVLIVEGKEKSGSLITAEFAMEQGKEVFAVPGSIRSPLSRGPHKLIQDGAKLVQSSSDILEEFGGIQKDLFASSSVLIGSTQIPSDPYEKKIYNTLNYTPLAFDVICEKTGIPSAQLSSVLMMMSLNGVVEDLGAGWVRK